jgi:hypothetical protein
MVSKRKRMMAKTIHPRTAVWEMSRLGRNTSDASLRTGPLLGELDIDDMGFP